MKLISTLLLTILLVPAAHAADCKVDGISDSPQKMSCEFPKFKVDLTCKKGTYFLNTSAVFLAYHLDVEEGASPLVFRATGLELTVTINSPSDIEAELDRSGTLLNGSCR